MNPQTQSLPNLDDSGGNLVELVEFSVAVPWEADPKTWRFTYVGPQALKLLGYSLKQWYQENFWVEHIHPEDREFAVDFCRKSYRTQEDFKFDYRMIAADNRIVWVHDMVSVVKNNGIPAKIRGYMIDVTDRKEVEEESRRQRIYLEKIVEERTAELAKANEQLSADLSKRGQTEKLIHDQMKRLSILREITVAITSTLDLRKVLDTLLEQIDHLLPYSAATIRLVNRQTGELEPVACRNIDAFHYPVPADRGILKEVLQTARPVLSVDV